MTSSPPPVIKFDKDVLKPETRNVAVDALQRYGCFMAEYGNLDTTRRPLFKESKEIFKLVAANNSGNSEFAYKTNDKCESFDIPDATAGEGIEKFITRMRPGRKDDDIRKAIRGYTNTAADLGAKVRKLAPERYKLPEESTAYIFRMMKHKKHKKEVILDFPKSADKFLAVLDLHQVTGLKMTTTDDQCFSIDVKPSTSSLLIMAGRPLKDWKEVKIHGEHGNEEKYSVGLFSYCKQVGSSSGS